MFLQPISPVIRTGAHVAPGVALSKCSSPYVGPTRVSANTFSPSAHGATASAATTVAMNASTCLDISDSPVVDGPIVRQSVETARAPRSQLCGRRALAELPHEP